MRRCLKRQRSCLRPIPKRRITTSFRDLPKKWRSGWERAWGAPQAPGGSIPPETQPTASAASGHAPTLQDRGLFHASDAMRGMYENGRRSELLHLRSHHGSQWKLLPLHELRINEWLLIADSQGLGGEHNPLATTAVMQMVASHTHSRPASRLGTALQCNHDSCV